VIGRNPWPLGSLSETCIFKMQMQSLLGPSRAPETAPHSGRVGFLTSQLGSDRLSFISVLRHSWPIRLSQLGQTGTSAISTRIRFSSCSDRIRVRFSRAWNRRGWWTERFDTTRAMSPFGPPRTNADGMSHQTRTLYQELEKADYR
jgi:hypothetical protein